MDQQLGIGMLRHKGVHLLRADRLVNVAITWIDNHVHPLGLPGDISSKKPVRHEQDAAIGGDRSDNLERIGRRAAVIALRLHSRGSVDVINHDGVWTQGVTYADYLG